MRRRLPTTFTDSVKAVAGGNGGDRFALLVERSWSFPDHTALRRRAIVWAHLGEHALSAVEIDYPDPQTGRFAIIDEAPFTAILGAFRYEPLVGFDPETGAQRWSNGELRRVESIGRVLLGTRLLAVRFDDGARLVDVDRGTWKRGVARASLAGTSERHVVIHDRKPASLVTAGRQSAVMDAVVAYARRAAIGHDLAVIAGEELRAFRLDGSTAWTLPGPARDVVACDAGFRALIGRDSDTIATMVDGAGRVRDEHTLPFASQSDLLGPDRWVSSAGRVIDLRSHDVAWDFAAELELAVARTLVPEAT